MKKIAPPIFLSIFFGIFLIYQRIDSLITKYISLIFLIRKPWIKYLIVNAILLSLPLFFFSTRSAYFNKLTLLLLLALSMLSFWAALKKETFQTLYKAIVIIECMAHALFFYYWVWPEGFMLDVAIYFLVLSFIKIPYYTNTTHAVYLQFALYIVPIYFVYLLQELPFKEAKQWLFLDAMIKALVVVFANYYFQSKKLKKLLDYKSNYANNIRIQIDGLKSDLAKSQSLLSNTTSQLQTKILECQNIDSKLAIIEAQNGEKSEFIDQINHAIRNSAHSILGVLEMIKAKGIDKSKKDQLKPIAKEIRQLMQLANTVVEFIALNQPSKLNYKAHSFKKLILAAESLTAIEGKKQSVNYILNIDPTLSDYARYDFEKITRALKLLVQGFSSLASNTEIKFNIEQIKEEAVSFTLRFTFLFQSKVMDASQFHQILDKSIQFQNIVNALKHKKSIAKSFNILLANEIVSKMNQLQGLTLEDYDDFSRVYFDVSFEKVSTVEQIKLKKMAFARRDKKLEDMLVLVVEDSTMNAKVASHMLEQLGSKVILAGNGQEGIDRCNEYADQLDLVLMDIEMPIMDGITATDVLRKKYGDEMIIVALTANNLESETMDYNRLGFNAYLAKPINKVALVNVLSGLVIN